MKLEPMEAPALPVLTPRAPEPPVEVCFAARLCERPEVEMPK
jgi:hypothetical protein